jgi:hypothetical protein
MEAAYFCFYSLKNVKILFLLCKIAAANQWNRIILFIPIKWPGQAGCSIPLGFTISIFEHLSQINVNQLIL